MPRKVENALSAPQRAAAFDVTSDGFFFVADSDKKDHRIIVLNAQKKPINFFGGPRKPGGLHFGNCDKLYVTDKTENCVHCYDLDNINFPWQFGAPNLSRPEGLVEDHSTIFVADSGNSRIVVYSTSGQMLRKFGEGILSRPSGLEIHGDNIVVCDTGNKRMVMFSKQGKFIKEFGTDLLYHPKAVTVDRKGRIIVADKNSFKVALFSPDGTYLNCISTLEKGKPIGVKNIGTNKIYVIIQNSGDIEEYELQDDCNISNMHLSKEDREVLDKWECSICHQGLDENMDLQSAHAIYNEKTRVVHAFHQSCLKKWMQEKHECPICREKLAPGPLRDVWVTNQTSLAARMGPNPFLVACAK